MEPPFYYEEEWRRHIPFTQKVKAVFFRKGPYGSGIAITKKELERVFKDGTTEDRVKVAEDMLSQTEDLRKEDMDYYRKSVERLAKDPSLDVRQGMVTAIEYESLESVDSQLYDWEPHVAEIVQILSGDKSPKIRQDIASIEWRSGLGVNKRNLKRREQEVCDIMRELAQDKDPNIRKEVASNSTIPAQCACSILDMLSDDRNGAVIEELLFNLSMRDNCADDIYKLVEKRAGDERGIVGEPYVE